jgi:hypothetical protein
MSLVCLRAVCGFAPTPGFGMMWNSKSCPIRETFSDSRILPGMAEGKLLDGIA